MGQEIDLLKNYPKTKRDTSQRSENKTEEDRFIARKFGKEFFDGDRKHGYGGFTYNSKFWEPVVPDFIDFYDLNPGDYSSTISHGSYEFATLRQMLTMNKDDLINEVMKYSKGKYRIMMVYFYYFDLPS